MPHMKTLLRSMCATVVLGLLLALPVASVAQTRPSGGRTDRPRDYGRLNAPEFDPAAVGAMAAVVAGGAVLIARRRKS